jgi:flagellar hook-associated protein 2
MNTVLLSSLNGGSGVRTGTINFTLRNGSSRVVDLSEAETLSDVTRGINQATNGLLFAEVEEGGTGIRIIDLTGGTGHMSVTGDMAADLHLAPSTDGDQIVSGDLQLQYISEGTLLSDLNNSKGVSYGDFTISLRNGVRTDISIDEGKDRTVGDVLRKINSLGIGVTAQINANGDGIELVGSTMGAAVMTVVEKGGSTAKDLGIEGTADETTNTITGSFAVTIDIDANDSLNDVVKKINDAGIGIRASVFSNESNAEPDHLMLSSVIGGTTGQIMYSAIGTDLDFDTLTRAGDAKVVMGDLTDPEAHIEVIGSDSNTIRGIAPGLSIDLVKVSDDRVEVTIDQDTDTIVANIEGFVDAFNETMDRIDELTKAGPDGEPGVLQGNRYASQLKSELLRLVTSANPDPSMEYRRLSDLGIMVDSQGGAGIRLTMNRTVGNDTRSYTIDGNERIQSAVETNLEAVKEFFTAFNIITNADGEDELQNIGFAARAKELIMRLTDPVDGTLKIATNAIDDRVELYERRAEYMQELLDIKENQLYLQFQAMEQALAGLQNQQSSLATLASLANSMNSSAGSGF